MLELHAHANGAGTYQVVFVTSLQDGLHQYSVPDAHITMEDIVADETGRQTVHFTVNGKPFAGN